MNSGPVIGIDLGTTNSLAAWVPAVEAEIIPGSPRAIVPSVVSREAGEWIVGDAARARRLTHPKQTLFSIKRLMGKTLGEVRSWSQSLPFAVVAGEQGEALVELDGERYLPEEIAALVLREIKVRAEAHFSSAVTRAVVTVPAYFDDVQRSATRRAAEKAGFEVLRLVNEPTAAALAYGLDDRDRGHVVVYDLGGGTFDVSLLRIENGIFQVLATAGNTLLGGDDFDGLIMNFLAETLQASPDSRLLQELRQVAEQGKIALSASSAVDLSVTLADGRSLNKRFTREGFEASIQPLVKKTLVDCQRVLTDAGLGVGDIDEVILVGGSTRIPLVRQEVEKFFGRKPHNSRNPDEVVALGAAVQGHILSGGTREMLLLDVTPLSLGIEILGGGMSRLIHRNTPLPCEAKDSFTTSADGQTGLELHVLQGERELAAHNRSLGRFRLTGFPPMAAGLPQFEVTFRLNADGLLTMTACEQRSGAELEVALKPHRGLSEDEVEKRRREAIEHSREDLQAIRAINIANGARVVLGAARKAFASCSDGLPEEVSQEAFLQMQAAADALEAVLDEGDTVMIEWAHEELNRLTAPLGDAMMSRLAHKL